MLYCSILSFWWSYGVKGANFDAILKWLSFSIFHSNLNAKKYLAEGAPRSSLQRSYKKFDFYYSPCNVVKISRIYFSFFFALKMVLFRRLLWWRFRHLKTFQFQRNFSMILRLGITTFLIQKERVKTDIEGATTIGSQMYSTSTFTSFTWTWHQLTRCKLVGWDKNKNN